MGKIYKLKPEIKEFVINEARSHPELGCRKLSLLIHERFGLNVSKSSISAIIKSGGLSSPIGRRITHNRRRPRVTSSPSALPGPSLLATAHTTTGASVDGPKAASPLEQAPVSSEIGEAREHIKTIPAPDLPKNQQPEQITYQTTAFPAEEEIQEKAGQPPPVVAGNGLVQTISSISQPPIVSQGLGFWFLKAAELSLGGIQAISNSLGQKSKDNDIAEFILKNETLLYMPLFGIEDPKMLDGLANSGLSFLVGRAFTVAEIEAYQDYIKPIGSLNLLLLTAVSSRLSFVRCVRFVLNDNNSFFIDAAAHSIWSGSHVPLDFSRPILKVKEYLDRSILTAAQPFILQAPPGFESPNAVFFNFINSLDKGSEDKRIERIEFLGQQGEILESVSAGATQGRRFFIIGLWPWQYERQLVVEEQSDYQPFCLELNGEDFLVAEGQILLKSKDVDEPVVLRSVILRRGQGRALNILSNIDRASMDLKQVARLYLERWPNLELGYQDYLGKIERASYSVQAPATSQVNMAALAETADLDLNRILGFWRVKLNEYCQSYFFPEACKNLDFALLKERFYGLGGRIKSQIGHFKVEFNVQSGFKYYDDLIYSCQRVNESNVVLPNGARLVFEA